MSVQLVRAEQAPLVEVSRSAETEFVIICMCNPHTSMYIHVLFVGVVSGEWRGGRSWEIGTGVW